MLFKTETDKFVDREVKSMEKNFIRVCKTANKFLTLKDINTTERNELFLKAQEELTALFKAITDSRENNVKTMYEILFELMKPFDIPNITKENIIAIYTNVRKNPTQYITSEISIATIRKTRKLERSLKVRQKLELFSFEMQKEICDIQQTLSLHLINSRGDYNDIRWRRKTI